MDNIAGKLVENKLIIAKLGIKFDCFNMNDFVKESDYLPQFNKIIHG